MKHILFIILCLVSWPSSIQAQTPTREQLIGTWIGVHSEWDTDLFCPLPTYIQLDTDSTYHLGMVDGSAAPLTSTWAVHGDSVRLDTIHYAPRLVRLQNSLLRIGTVYPMVFRKFNPIPIDSTRACQQLTGCVWQSDSLIISLYANGKASLEDPTTHKRTAHFWRLARFGTSVFLVIRGNQHNRDSGYKPLWQLSSLSPKHIQAIGWNGHRVATESFQFSRSLTPGDSCRPSGFQPCDNCFARMWYATTIDAEKRYELKRLFEQYYQTEQKPGESGLLKIEFVVTCTGERGLFHLSGFDEAYQCKDFDPQITRQLLAICRNHIPADLASFVTDQPGRTPQDLAVSLTFRLKDGCLIEIFP